MLPVKCTSVMFGAKSDVEVGGDWAIRRGHDHAGGEEIFRNFSDNLVAFSRFGSTECSRDDDQKYKLHFGGWHPFLEEEEEEEEEEGMCAGGAGR